MISKCYLKLKNYKYLLEFLDKSIDALKKSMGGEPSDDIISKIKQKSKIYAEEGNIQNAME